MIEVTFQGLFCQDRFLQGQLHFVFCSNILDLATHDVILENPATGQKSIYLDPNKTLGIDGLSEDESKELIDAVSQHMLQDDLIYTHTWRNGDVVMWDNARLWHRREAFDASLPRFARRTTIFLRPDDFAVPEPGLT